MINVSNEFKQLMKRRTDFKEYAEITLTDGTKIFLDEADFTISGNEIVDGAGLSSFPVGVAVQKRIQLKLINDVEQFEALDFFGAKIRLYLTFALSRTTERIEKGIYTVVNPATPGETITINAYDDMYRTDKPYETALVFPAALGAMLREICSKCDIPLLSTTFANSDMEVREAPSGSYTYRQIIGYIAMLAGGNARINCSGYLEIKTYEFLEHTYDGGDFTFSNGDTVLDGGDFSCSDGDDAVDGGAFDPWAVDSTDYIGGIPEEQLLTDWKRVNMETNDIAITGVKLRYQTDEGEKSVMTGKEGYVLSVENPLVSADIEQGILTIGDKLVGLRFRRFDGEHIGNPLIEFMDMVFVTDRRGRTHKSFVTDVTFRFMGYTIIKNDAPSYIGNEVSYPSQAAIVEAAARKLIEKEKTDRELAQEQLAKALANSSGLYPSEAKQPDGSTIFYLHDKPTLKESKTIIKLTAEAIGVSTDGGKTYPYGFTVTGEMIVRILSAEGINADWIKVGTLNADLIQSGEMLADRIKGGILTLGGKANGDGVLRVLDASGNEIGKWDNTGVHLNAGKIEGPTVVVGGSNNKFGTLDFMSENNVIRMRLSNDTFQFFNDSGTKVGELKYTRDVIDTGTGKRHNCLDFGCPSLGVSNAVYAHFLIFDDGKISVRCSDEVDFMDCKKVQFDGDADHGVYIYAQNQSTSGSEARLVLDGSSNANYRFYRGTSSSQRYKDIERSMTEMDVERLYSIQPVFAKYKDGYLSEDDERCGVYHPMFIAEDVEKYAPFAVDHLPDGRAENWNYRVMIPYMFQMIKSQKETIDDLTGRLKRLETMMKGDA